MVKVNCWFIGTRKKTLHSNKRNQNASFIRQSLSCDIDTDLESYYDSSKLLTDYKIFQSVWSKMYNSS